MHRILRFAVGLIIVIALVFASYVPVSTAVVHADTLPTTPVSGCNFGDCSTATPPVTQQEPAAFSTAITSSSVSATSGSITGITDPSQISPQTVYDFSADAPGTNPTTFSGGTFAGTGQILVVGSSWTTWNPQDNGKHVLFASASAYTITFSRPQRGVAVKAEPNLFNFYNITIEAFDKTSNSLGSFTRLINGYGGAAFLGLLSSSQNIASVKLTGDPTALGFAFSDITYSGNIPAPTQVPVPQPFTIHQESGVLSNVTFVYADASLTSRGLNEAQVNSVVFTAEIDVPACLSEAKATVEIYSKDMLVWETGSVTLPILFGPNLLPVTQSKVFSVNPSATVSRGNAYILVDYFTLVGQLVYDPHTETMICDLQGGDFAGGTMRLNVPAP